MLKEVLADGAPSGTPLAVLARRVLRDMAESVSIGVGGTPLVPTGFVVFLAPEDEAVLDPVRRWFCADVAAAFVVKASGRGGLGAVDAPVVTLAVDPGQPAGEPRVSPSFAPRTVGAEVAPPQPGDRRTRLDSAPALAGEGSTWRIEGSALVGRSSGCDVTVEDELVSRNHCRILREGGGWAVEDRGSANGTTVAGRPVRGLAPLRDGDEIILAGRVSLRFSDQSGRLAPAVTAEMTRQ